MRLLFFVLLTSPLFAATDPGVVSIRFPYSGNHRAKIYTSATEKKPLMITGDPEQLDSLIGSFFLYGGTNFVTFCCSGETEDRYCIHGTNEFTRFYWVEKDSLTTFDSWNDWWTGFGQVAYGGDTIFTAADEHAPLVKRSCPCYLFDVYQISGDWMQVAFDLSCEDYFQYNCPSEKAALPGWIRWRKGNTIYIDTYIAE